MSEYKHLDFEESIAMRLAETIPKDQNQTLYFDNYFASFLFIQELKNTFIRCGREKSDAWMHSKKRKGAEKRGGATDWKIN